MELLLPTFKVSYEAEDKKCVGKSIEQTADGTDSIKKWVKCGTFASDIELSSMKVNAASINSQISKNTEIVSSDFLFGKYNSQLILFSVNRR